MIGKYLVRLSMIHMGYMSSGSLDVGNVDYCLTKGETLDYPHAAVTAKHKYEWWANRHLLGLVSHTSMPIVEKLLRHCAALARDNHPDT